MNKISQLISIIQPLYTSEDPAHDWAHIGRVAKTAQKLAKHTAADLSCLLAAVYCHDLVNLPKDHPQRAEASRLAGEKAEHYLRQAGYVTREIELIKQIILEHSFSKGLRPSSLEAEILQDADRLDALGAIGILRCAAVNTKMGSQFYDPFDPFAEERDHNDKRFMVDHYFVKLFQLPQMMNTESGRKEAEERVQFMQEFLHTLRREIR